MRVSVIIPVYNSIEYLRRSVDNVLDQSFEDYEILLIDDGSTDGSDSVCDEYAEQYDRVRVIHKNHGGVSAACNCGIDNAAGKYLMFCDSDDFAEQNWIETLYRYAEQYPDRFVLSAFFKDEINHSQTVRLKDASPNKQFSSDEYYYLYKNGFSAYRWNRIYRRDAVIGNHIRFDDSISIGEDVIFNIEYLKCCTGFLYIDKPLYHWVNNGNDSLSRAYHVKYYDDIKALYYPRISAIAEKDKQAFYNEYFYRFYNCIDIVNDERNTMTDKEKKAYIRYMLHDDAFCHALEHSENSRLKSLLRFKSYSILRFYNQIHRIIKGR